MIKVLVVDDHRIVIDGLKLLLDSILGIEVLGSASNGREALQFLEVNQVDVVLMDIHMPVMNGLEACKEIKQRFSSTSIIALTMAQEASLIKAMFKAGASGYLMKNTDKDEIEQAIKTVVSGTSYYGKEVSGSLLSELKGEQRPNQAGFPKLSKREKQILQMIVDEMTTGEIAKELFISFGTVETHRRNIINKLGVRNTAGIVRTALEYNLLA